eukprot:TRINITY_DN4194_c0_g1_i1.p1 TRINITY_DN4194_c0_g1~~TRINITY_DN4194_c0_g1_i1.p1  ORF type:complete len:773 (-),score=130.52 TRINITY_DN4194_c0_g1_i1:64-2301(-)
MKSRQSSLAIGVRILSMILLVSVFGMAVFLVVKEVQRSTNPSDNKNNDNNNTPVVIPPSYAEMAKTASSMIDFSADPCHDFYQYACGTFVSNTPLPQGVSMLIPTFTTIEANNNQILEEIVNNQWPIINDFYTSCVQNQDDIDADTLLQLGYLMDSKINVLPSTQDSDLLPVLASLHYMGVDAFFNPGVLENIFGEDNPLNHLMLNLGGFTQAVNYSQPDAPLSVGYLAEISSVIELFNNISNVPEVASNIFNLEGALANIVPQDIEDITDVYVNMTYGEFKSSVTSLDFDTYIDGLELGSTIKDTTVIIVSVPGFFTSLANVTSNADLATVKYYLQWRLVLSLFSYNVLGEDSLKFATAYVHKASMRRANMHSKSLNAILRDRFPSPIPDQANVETSTSAYTPTPLQTQECVSITTSLLGDFVGLLFSQQIVTDDTIWAIRNMTSGIQNAFSNGLDSLSWISDDSKVQARNKLYDIIQIIGHPNKLDRYRGVVMTSSYVANVISLQKAAAADMLSNVETPFIRANYEFPATVVNAFYYPLTNTINFPAGILESPMFSTNLPVMFQYARMGYVVGHETTHGFDNNGRMWGPTGVYGDWMDQESSANFVTQAQCVIDQFNDYYVTINGQQVPVNGMQTLGENIADLGGAKNSYRAYQAWVKANGQEFPDKSIISSLNNEQLFWVLLGQTWCTVASDQALARQIMQDPHSPSKFRVNGPLSNIDEFASAFSCPAGTAMNPTDKCLIW